jgi:hypothetical protein
MFRGRRKLDMSEIESSDTIGRRAEIFYTYILIYMGSYIYIYIHAQLQRGTRKSR